jgi:hypothetical protein
MVPMRHCVILNERHYHIWIDYCLIFIVSRDLYCLLKSWNSVELYRRTRFVHRCLLIQRNRNGSDWVYKSVLPSLSHFRSFSWSCVGTLSIVLYYSLHISRFSASPYLCVQSVLPNRIICFCPSTHYFLPLLSTLMSSACSSVWNFTPHFKSVLLFRCYFECEFYEDNFRNYNGQSSLACCSPSSLTP